MWNKIYNDYKSPRPLKYNILNNSVSAINLNTIFGLSDSVLIPMVQIVPPGSKFVIGGSSFQNILLPASSRFENCNTTLFHWNGSKWSFELCGYSVDPSTDVYMINPNYFYVVAINQFDGTYIFRGIKK